MKKILAAALALCMTMGATALAEGTFRVGVKQDVYGFGYYDEATGEVSGMEIELGEKLAEALGYDEVEYTAVTAATRGQMLDNDELDCVIATFTIKPERKESWDFSTPYYVDAVTVLVKDASGITDLAGLKGKTVGVSSGSTSAKALSKAMAEAGVIDAFDEDTFDAATFNGGVSFKIFDDYPAISMALDAGDVDAFCVDKSILANYKTDGRSFIEDSFSPQEYGVATKKGSELSGKIEALITEWLADGTVMLTMFFPANKLIAEAAAIECCKRMNLTDIEVISKEIMHPAEGTRIEAKGKVPFSIEIDKLVLPKEPDVMSDDEIRADIERKPMKVVCGTVGEDEHSVGLREIIDIKHGGIEKYGIEVHYLGTSVPPEKLVNAAVELNADAMLASTIISHDDIHYKNISKINRIATEMGIRDKVIFVAGGTQVVSAQARANGADEGFGRGSHGNHVATFLVKKRWELEKEGKM